MREVPIHHVPGEPGHAGEQHARLIGDILNPRFVDAYIHQLAEVIRFTPDDLPQQAVAWLDRLPVQYQEEIAGMARGSELSTARITEFLYADIAHATRTEQAIAGPMCSAVVAQLDDRQTWIGRNCDWLVPTLTRGTAAVVHETPHRIPVMAVGIRGDIDVDTGINAERLWLHIHTLHAVDETPRDRTMISWLFWAREALETCASLDDLERFIRATARDRGVFAVAGDGKTNEAAIFECTRATHTRHDIDPEQPACVTNHTLDAPQRPRRPDAPPSSGTISRYQALRHHIETNRPRGGPDDLISCLAHPHVEMRTRPALRTIYAAVANPQQDAIWFAAGHHDGTPAASKGAWSRVTPPWTS